MAVWIYRGFLRIAAGYRLCSPREAQTCVHRVGSLEASRKNHAIPVCSGVRVTHRTGVCGVQDGAGWASEVWERLRVRNWTRYLGSR